MTIKEFYKIQLYVTAAATVAIWLLLIWEYTHGGVLSHHVLQREDLPAFSNWWGGLLIPLLTWFLLQRIQKRISIDSENIRVSKTIIYTFIAALTFGILLSLFFTWGYIEIPFYMVISLFLLAFFFPIYRAECFLGFVLGMTFTFGGVLPLLIISIFSVIGTLLFHLIRPAILFVITTIKNLVS
ncbi:MAG: hypothetical protein RLY16_476, partial [Bacteroidota bacterium]